MYVREVNYATDTIFMTNKFIRKIRNCNELAFSFWTITQMTIFFFAFYQWYYFCRSNCREKWMIAIWWYLEPVTAFWSRRLKQSYNIIGWTNRQIKEIQNIMPFAKLHKKRYNLMLFHEKIDLLWYCLLLNHLRTFSGSYNAFNLKEAQIEKKIRAVLEIAI